MANKQLLASMREKWAFPHRCSLYLLIGLLCVPALGYGQTGPSGNTPPFRGQPAGQNRIGQSTSLQTTSQAGGNDRRLANTSRGAGPGGIGEAGVLAQPLIPDGAGWDPQSWTSPTGLTSSLKVMLLLTVLSLAPSILIMTTCFVRFVVVFGLLRQALGTQQLPPNQVLMALSLFLTTAVMWPVWQQAYDEGIRPYSSPAIGVAPLDEQTALTRTLRPLREFMSQQIEHAGNGDSLWLFIDFQRPPEGSAGAASYREPTSYDEVPLSALVPAYMLSELKVAFVIGFQIFLPFLIIDMVVSSLLISMGMMMLPPVLVSLPFKLLLFVLIDGWSLTVGLLLESVAIGG